MQDEARESKDSVGVAVFEVKEECLAKFAGVEVRLPSLRPLSFEFCICAIIELCCGYLYCISSVCSLVYLTCSPETS